MAKIAIIWSLLYKLYCRVLLFYFKYLELLIKMKLFRRRYYTHFSNIFKYEYRPQTSFLRQMQTQYYPLDLIAPYYRLASYFEIQLEVKIEAL